MTYRFFVGSTEKKEFSELEKRKITDRIFGPGYRRLESKDKSKAKQYVS